MTNSADVRALVADALRTSADHLDRLARNTEVHDEICRAGALIAEAMERGGRVISCGNGGSMSDAMHFAEELTGRFREDRLPLPAVAISDPAYLTCTANDFGYEHVFARFVEAFGRDGDVLVAISTSGTSPNVLRAVRSALAQGMSVVGLTGRGGSPLADEATVAIVTAGDRYADRVQEQHIVVLHTLVEIVERAVGNTAS